ncbi:serine hydrolase domain-containing protein [Aquimarina sp. MMG016]|uniref:serine hydrolase domain-containing protein n=1 Tax=Aquimarina sp. MMG016 TaxID=2822690 RepID=UPI001B3A4791|nr:serine hydrolase domain-containing protein [Aquimarina sp. MMG016]MBQ4818799.1 beta-lactamase family protein [Aquimarina sp. MMG016]
MRKLLVIAVPSMLLFVLLISFISANHSESEPIASMPQQIQQPTVPEITIHKPDPYKILLAEAIEKYFQKALDKNQIVGASVAIVKCDSIIYVDGFGNKDTKLKDQIDKNTIFRIGSVSKGFGGILTGIHVEDGLIHWGDKIIDHIPNFQLASKKQTGDVTISNVLSHTSGLPYHSFTNLVEDGLSLTTIAGRFREVLPIQNPGSIYNYQNAAFALSGEVIERITGKPMREVIKERIFDPLQMSTASASYEELGLSDNVAMPHQRLYGRWRTLPINKKYYNAVAAGGVNASATDMAKWMKFLLGHNPEVLSAKGIQEVFNPQIQVGGRRQYYQRWPGYVSSHYAHGWRIHKFRDDLSGELNTVIHHGGHVNNYRSEVAVFPNEDLGICILFNSPTKLARVVIPEIHQIIKDVMDEVEHVEYVAEDLQAINFF